MRNTVLLFIALVLLASTASAQVPRGVIAEDCTATWCQYCPDAYAGLEVMKHHYDTTEFTAIRYYSSSSGGGLATPETDARISYYHVTGFPTVVFDGTIPVVGGGATVATGSVYEPIVASEIGRPSPIRVRINSVDLVQPDGSINLDLIVADNIPDISNTKIRIAILENNVTWNTEVEQDVVRDLLPDVALTVSQTGQIQNVVQNFTLNPSWKTQDLWAAVFIQKDTDKSILQSASTRPAPPYSIRYWAQGAKGAIVPSNSPAYEFQNFAVYNMGTNSDVIRVTLNAGTMPSGWSCAFTDGTTDYSDYLDLSLAPGEGRIFHLKVTPGAVGYAAPQIVLTSNNLPGIQRVIPYQVITNDVTALVVDDDGGQSYETYYADGLSNMGLTYGIWSTSVSDVTPSVLSPFAAVIWEIGLSYPTLTATDRTALGGYLDAGGKLFITGQDLGWELADPGSYVDPTWYHNYLHVNYVGDNAGSNNLTGVSGDPISNGMTLALTPSLNPYPDYFTPRDSYTSVIFTYNTSPVKNGAVKIDTGVYKVVYLGFGFEAITTQANRRLLLQRSMQWFGFNPTATPQPTAGPAELSVTAWPNPASGAVSLSYELASASRVRLEIYSPSGALVRTLVNAEQPAGRHTMGWDGRDNGGAAVASGVYFYRLNGGASAPAGKLVLTR